MNIRIQRLIEDGKEAGWVVDLEAPWLEDTSGQFFRWEQDARAFAQRLSDLLINVPITQAEDDVL